jgi:tetratricopeptide (TPR) repeat protein
MLVSVAMWALLGSAQVVAPPPQEQAKILFEEANALHEKQQDEKAVAAYDRAIALQPDNPAFHIGRANALAKLRKYQDAIQACTEALRLDPGNVPALLGRGHFRINLKQIEPALVDLVQAEKACKTDYWIYYHLGLAHYIKGDFAQAAKAYTSFLGLKKGDTEVVEGTAWLYPSLYRAGKKAEANALLKNIRSGMGGNAMYLDRLMLFKGEKTEKQLREAMEKGDPKSRSTIAYGIGLWHVLHGRNGAAKEYFHMAMDGGQPTAFGYIAAEADLARIESAKAIVKGNK